MGLELTLCNRQKTSVEAYWDDQKADLKLKVANLKKTLSSYPAYSITRLYSSNQYANSLSTSDAQPTRTLSESTIYPPSASQRLPSISENEAPTKSTRSVLESFHNIQAAPRTLGSAVDPSSKRVFDGIHFKSGIMSNAVQRTDNLSQSPSRIVTTSSPANSYSLQTRASNIENEIIRTQTSPVRTHLDQLSVEDNLTRDAGHTPLASRVAHSDLPTPTQPEQERPPLEPGVSVLKTPSERSDSYFPSMEEDEADQTLKSPLTLVNDKVSDERFFDELDSKLAEAAISTASSVPRANCSDALDSKDSFDVKVPRGLELEPKLRIKRSMNFGSQLGGF